MNALLLWAAVSTFSANGPFVIPELGQVESAVTVPEVGRLSDVTVTLTLHHPRAGALRVTLTAPDGSIRRVLDRRGGAAAGLESVTFSDAAPALPPAKTGGAEPLREASYLPAESLSFFAGKQIRGVWTLRVTEVAPSDPEPRTLESWSMKLKYEPNRAPVAVCQSVSVDADANSCDAPASIDAGTFDPDRDEMKVTMEPAGQYPLGTREVKLTATDPYGESNSCTATVTVVDVTPPVISCNTPEAIQSYELPATFTPTATDACGTPTVRIRAVVCRSGDGAVRDKCAVDAAGGAVTITDTGGRSSTVEWAVVARDASGNSARATCRVNVLYPPQP